MIDLPNFVPALLGNQSLFEFEIDGVDGLSRVVRFSGHEGISSLFEFHVELAGPDIDLREIIGKTACLTIDGVDQPRHVHGIISHVEYGGHSRRYTLYELTLVPPLWRLLHRVDCRVFQHETTEQVLTKVFKEAGLDPKSFRFDLKSGYGARNYCIQYRESDFAFVSRLMEEDGIFYFFEHTEEGTTLIIADHPGAHKSIPGNPLVMFNEGSQVRGQEHVTHIRLSESIRPGKISLRDFNFHKPEQEMEVNADAENDVDLEVYDYPGEFQDPAGESPHQGKSMAKIRLEAHQAGKRQASGGSDCMRLMPGYTFALAGHGRAEVNGEYLLTRVMHHGSQPQVLDEDGQGAFHYGNDFACIPKDTPYRPPRHTPRPVVRGIQSATVVGAGSEEVHTDEHGRVMVQFHWDRKGEHNEKSSCWVRVSQLWAGNGWGAMFIPRVGHEVLVDFIEGDPDRPIITGRVYHAKNALPYPLPDEKTKTTIKSNSSLGGGGFNELRFEDKKGSEEVFLHAQKDWNTTILNNHTESVGANRSSTIGSNESITVGASRTSTISASETINVGAGRTLSVGANDATSVGGVHTVSIVQPPSPPPPPAGGGIIGAALAALAGAAAAAIGPTGSEMRDKFYSVTTGQATITMEGPNVFIEAAGEIVIKGKMIHLNP